MYVFGGIGISDQFLDTMESLEIQRILDGNRVEWKLIELQPQGFLPREDLFVSPLNNSEIVIMGG